MKLIKSKNCNINYLAKVVNIKVFRKHSNPEVTKLKCCTIDGFNIITSIDAEPGLYIYISQQLVVLILIFYPIITYLESQRKTMIHIKLVYLKIMVRLKQLN